MSLLPSLTTFVAAARESEKYQSGLPPWYQSSRAIESAVFIGGGASFSVYRQKIHSVPAHDELVTTMGGLTISTRRPTPNLPDFVAYKVIKANLKANGEPQENDRVALVNALQELLALTHIPLLQHPYIVDFLGLAWTNSSGSGPHLPVPIVEYASHGSLKSFLKQNRIETSLKRSLCVHVGLGLDALHRCGIIHGDVKPDNVLVTLKGSNLVAKLADFGSSTLGNAWPSWLSGTFLWSAPEVSHSNVKLPLMTDVYSYGLLAWSVGLEGENPFEEFSKKDSKRVTPTEIVTLKGTDVVLELALEWNRTMSSLDDCTIEHAETTSGNDTSKESTGSAQEHENAGNSRYFYGTTLANVFSSCLPHEPSQRSLQKALDAFGASNESLSLSVPFYPLANSNAYQGSLSNARPFQWQLIGSLEPRVKRSLVTAYNERSIADIKGGKVPFMTHVMAIANVNAIGKPKNFPIAIQCLLRASRGGFLPSKALLYRFHRALRLAQGDQIVVRCDRCGEICPSKYYHCRTCDNFDLCNGCVGQGCDEGQHHTFDRYTLTPATTVEPAKPLLIPLPDEYEPLADLVEVARKGSFAALSEMRELDKVQWQQAFTHIRNHGAGVGADFFDKHHLLEQWDPKVLLAEHDLRAAITQRYAHMDAHDYGGIKFNQRGDEIIHYAASSGLSSLVNWLLDLNPGLINRPNKESETPLLCACRAGQVDVVRILLAHQDVKAAIPTCNGDTPLHWLVQFDKRDLRDIIKGLLDHGADIEAHALCPIPYSASKMDVEYPYGEQYCQGTPLHWAVCRNSRLVVGQLLHHGAHPSASKWPPDYPYKSSQRDFSPIELAAFLHHPEILKMLADAAKAKDLYYMRSKSLQNLVRGSNLFSSILRHGVDHDSNMRKTLAYLTLESPPGGFLTGIDASGSTLLMEAISHGSEELALAILNHPRWRAEINTHCGNLNMTPILNAIHQDMLALAQKLYLSGADLKAKGTRLSMLGPSEAWHMLHYYIAAGHSSDAPYFRDNLLPFTNPVMNSDPAIESPFALAIDYDDFSMATILLKTQPQDLEITCTTACQGSFNFSTPTTPLGRIIKANLQNSVPRLEYLLSLSPKPEFTVTPASGLTALHEAARLHLDTSDVSGRPLELEDVDALSNREILLTLLQEWSEPEQLDAKMNGTGKTALHLAVESRNDVAVEELVSAGASVDVRDGEGLTAREKVLKAIELLEREEPERKSKGVELERLRVMLELIP